MLRHAVRVKRCGKSAPRTRQRGRHGKPHREQNRIGTMLARKGGGAGFQVQSSGLVARGAQQCASQRNGRHVGGKFLREPVPGHPKPGLQAGWHPHRSEKGRERSRPFPVRSGCDQSA
ncbi:hypothetical protein BOSE127_10049 [Bosea sp. 127]|nr:hypothetical protein BOSE127_10049 [Bosea sp. 127]